MRCHAGFIFDSILSNPRDMGVGQQDSKPHIQC